MNTASDEDNFPSQQQLLDKNDDDESGVGDEQARWEKEFKDNVERVEAFFVHKKREIQTFYDYFIQSVSQNNVKSLIWNK